jgi:hypothetical protein
MKPARLNVVFTSPREVLKYSRSGGKELSIFFPCGHPPNLGDSVSLGVTFVARHEEFELQGVVTFIRDTSRGLMQPQGVVVNFVSPEQRKKAAEFIAFCAGRPASAGTAGAQRTQVDELCVVHAARSTVRGSVRDLSSTGAFVAAPLPRTVRPGADVELRVRPWLGLFGGQRRFARVIWIGSKYGQQGFGVRFVPAL